MSKKKKKAKKVSIKKYIKENRHRDIFEVIKHINKVLTGLYAYYGINGMIDEMLNLKYYAFETILNVYKKRSQRNKFNYSMFKNILNIIPLSNPKVYHNIWI